MTIAQVRQSADCKPLRVGFACRGQRVDVDLQAFAGLMNRICAQVTHHPERMNDPVNNFLQKPLHDLKLVSDNGGAS